MDRLERRLIQLKIEKEALKKETDEASKKRLEKLEEEIRKLEVEFGQLQLEQSTWAMHSRIEKIAGGQLMMRVPPTTRIQVLPTEVTQ